MLNCLINWTWLYYSFSFGYAYYEWWTNPEWWFGWLPSLSIWMGRRRAWVVALVSYLSKAGASSFTAFLESSVCRLWLGRLRYVWGLWLFLLLTLLLRWRYIDDVVWLMTWLLGFKYLCWLTVGDVLLNVDVLRFYSVAKFWKNVLFMHAWWFNWRCNV